MIIHNLLNPILIPMKELMLLFGVTLAKRFTKRQKRIFYSQIEPFFKKMGYSLEYQESRKGLSNIVNIMIGDVSHAKYIVMCPYDTPSRSLLRFIYYPFHWSKNIRQENKELFLRSFVFIVSCVLGYFLLEYSLTLTIFLKILSILVLAAFLLFCYQLIIGFANPVNFNRNSASLALVAALAEKTAAKRNICYVLLDKNTSTNAGLKMLVEGKNLKNKKCLFLDCVAEGEQLVIAHDLAESPEAENLISALKKTGAMDFPVEAEQLGETGLQFLPGMLRICVGSFENGDLTVRNTRSKQDMKVDIPELEILRDGLLDYLRR